MACGALRGSGTIAAVSGIPGSVAEVVRLVEDGQPAKYLLFWSHRPRRDASPGPGCLSQWWPAPFEVDGRRFATAEHYMMWRKATLFGDIAMAERILSAEHPQRAKALGAQVRDFDEEAWRQHRFDIVVVGNLAKFGQHGELRDFLLATGERVLVEASPVDTVWGIGLAAGDVRTENPKSWRGLNLLGFALMRVRAALRAQAVRADEATA